MLSRTLSLGCLVALAWACSSPAGDEEGLSQLQRAVQTVIGDAEPAIACILVSRSDGYQRFGQGPAVGEPGKLGGFSPDAALRHVNAQRPQPEEQERLAEEIARLNLASPANVPESYGSGVVFDEAGLILTNYHVVRSATKIFVRLPDRRGGYADIHAADPRSDLAVLRLLNPPQNLKAVKLGDGGAVRKGQFVVALANPYAAGFRDGQPSASWGIISNLRRRAPATPKKEEDLNKTLHHYGTLLQTDVRLNLGCSGGALFNLKGEMIGLTTALAAITGRDTPGGFAVPLDAGMKRILDVLKKGEEVEYGFLGVGPETRAEPGEGVTVQSIRLGSPAERAGLHIRDTILAVNGVPVREADELFLALGTHLAGSQVTLDVRPDKSNHTKKVPVTLAKFYVPGVKIASAKRPAFRGLRVDYTSVLAQQRQTVLGDYRIPNGVLVTEVLSPSAAAAAFLKPGEVITHVNGQAVNSPAAFYQAVRGLRGDVELTLLQTTTSQAAPKVTLH
jgi:S1-C subfamily serine protease